MVIYFSGTGNSKYIAQIGLPGSPAGKLLCMNVNGSNQAIPGLLRQGESDSGGTDLCMKDSARGF